MKRPTFAHGSPEPANQVELGLDVAGADELETLVRDEHVRLVLRRRSDDAGRVFVLLALERDGRQERSIGLRVDELVDLAVRFQIAAAKVRRATR